METPKANTPKSKSKRRLSDPDKIQHQTPTEINKIKPLAPPVSTSTQKKPSNIKFNIKPYKNLIKKFFQENNSPFRSPPT